MKRSDRVSLDGRCGTAIAFWAKEERSVLVRFDSLEVLEVPEWRLLILPPLAGA